MIRALREIEDRLVGQAACFDQARDGRDGGFAAGGDHDASRRYGSAGDVQGGGTGEACVPGDDLGAKIAEAFGRISRGNGVDDPFHMGLDL